MRGLLKRGFPPPSTPPALRRDHESRSMRLSAGDWVGAARGGRAGRTVPQLVQRFAARDPSQRPSRAVRTPSRSGGNSDSCSVGRPGRRPRLPGCDPARPVAGGSARRPSGRTSTRSPSSRCTCSRTSSPRRSPTRTMHGVMHLIKGLGLGWATAARWLSLVKPNGLLGEAYMAAIRLSCT